MIQEYICPTQIISIFAWLFLKTSQSVLRNLVCFHKAKANLAGSKCETKHPVSWYEMSLGIKDVSNIAVVLAVIQKLVIYSPLTSSSFHLIIWLLDLCAWIVVWHISMGRGVRMTSSVVMTKLFHVQTQSVFLQNNKPCGLRHLLFSLLTS